MTGLARHVTFEACFNFRDLGGYETADGRRLRWNVLYRSDTLHRLTPSDAEMFRSLGLHTVMDLRSQREIDDYGAIRVDDGGFAWHNVPMLDNVRLAPPDPSPPGTPPPEPPPEALLPGAGYYMILTNFSESVAKVLAVLGTDGALPAVYHCTSGKDRTGIISALILDLLGVPEDVIADDYVLTEAARERSSAYIKANEPEFAALLAQIPPERRTTRRENILGMLERVRSEHDSVEQLLYSFGVTHEQLDHLRNQLLDD